MASNKGAGENVPPNAKPGAIDALAATAPIMVQLNPEGKWHTKKLDNDNDRKLQEIVQHLIASKAITGENSCCSQCAAENLKCGKEGGDKQSGSNFVPIIMMPVYSSENSPFDYECDSLDFAKDGKHLGPAAESKKPIANSTEKRNGLDADNQQKNIKRAFVLQRFTDFDLMSQW